MKWGGEGRGRGEIRESIDDGVLFRDFNPLILEVLPRLCNLFLSGVVVQRNLGFHR